jgi:hypothetical protein
MKKLMIPVLIVLFGFAPPKLDKIKLDGGITILVPQGWRPMDNMDFSERYPSVRAPLAAYTNDERMVDFSVNISATQWPDTDIELAKSFFKASIVNTFDKVDFITEGVREKQGKKFIYFEFDSRVNGSKREEGLNSAILKYSYIEYFIGSGRTIVFSFACPVKLKQEWQATAHKMMDGIKVR